MPRLLCFKKSKYILIIVSSIQINFIIFILYFIKITIMIKQSNDCASNQDAANIKVTLK